MRHPQSTIHWQPVWLGIGLLLASSSSLADGVKNDWSRVESVTPGKKVQVRLYNEGALRLGIGLKSKGRFASATTDSITLVLPGGQSRTLQKRDIRKVHVQRPARKRVANAAMAAGVLAGVDFALASLVFAKGGGDRGEFLTFYGVLNLLTSAPAALKVGLFSPGAEIYDVPPKHRIP